MEQRVTRGMAYARQGQGELEFPRVAVEHIGRGRERVGDEGGKGEEERVNETHEA